MIRDDDSQISRRELSRWLLPVFIVLLGLVLYFMLVKGTRAMATPIPVEMPQL